MSYNSPNKQISHVGVSRNKYMVSRLFSIFVTERANTRIVDERAVASGGKRVRNKCHICQTFSEETEEFPNGDSSAGQGRGARGTV